MMLNQNVHVYSISFPNLYDSLIYSNEIIPRHTRTRSLLYINASDRIDGRLKVSSLLLFHFCVYSTDRCVQ